MADKKSLSTMQVEVEQLSNEIDRLLANTKKRGVHNFTTRFLEARVTKLNEYYTKALDYHCEVVAATTVEARSELSYFQNNVIETLQSRFDKADEYLSEQLDVVASLEPSVTDVSHLNRSTTETHSVQVKLPKVDLPKFSGEIEKWPEFRDLFTALVHDNTSLSDVQRLQYLCSCLGGDAKDTVASLSLVLANYKVACDLLKNRYDNKRVMVSTLLNRLTSIPSIRSDNLSDLKLLRNIYTVVLESVKKLKIPVDNWDPIVIHLLTLKFDKTLRKDWELSLSDTRELPTFKQFDDFLNAQIRIHDALAVKAIISGPFSTPVKPKTVHAVTTGPKSSTPKASHNVTPKATPKVSSAVKQQCPLCKQDHFLSRCPGFTSKSPQQRFDEAKSLKLCLNCLSNKHQVGQCTSKFTCRTCQKRHHTMLHFPQGQSKPTNVGPAQPAQPINQSLALPATSGQPAAHNVATHTLSVNLATVMLAMARVVVRAPSGLAVICRALIDQGSEVSFVSETIAQALKLPRSKTDVSVTGLGSLFNTKVTNLVTIGIAPHFAPHSVTDMQALVLQSITDYRPPSWNSFKLPLLRALQLADPQLTNPDKIDVLIGADVFATILMDGVLRIGEHLIAQATQWGWVLSGKLNDQNTTTVSSHHISLTELNNQLTSFWDIEEIHKSDVLSMEDENTERHFQDTYTRTSEGRFVVRLPFKLGKDRSMLGRSDHIALATLNRLKLRLKQNDKLQVAYHDFLREYEELGHMRQLQSTELKQFRVFIPHQGVIREDKITTKLRVVYNASCPTSSGISLNDVLAIGPKLQTDITGVLLKWRSHRYVLCADIEKMFRQIVVHPLDRDLQNIVWFDPLTDQMKKYELTTVTYGTGPAPYLAIRVIDEIARLTKTDFPLAYQVLTQNRYVDDLMFGADDQKLLVETRSQVEQALKSGGFILKKWHTNAKETLTKEDLKENAALMGAGNEHLVKLLGIQWNSHDDSLRMKINTIETHSHTKRTILSDIAKLFDPLGWLSPLIVRAKCFMQTLWTLQLGWDDPLPEQTLTAWRKLAADLSQLPEQKICRWMDHGSHCVTSELIGFSDASEKAYSAVVYLRVTDMSGLRYIHLLMAKSRVTPLGKPTIPRLELCGAVLFKDLIVHLKAQLSFPLDRIICFSDSTVVLAWLRKPPSTWGVFVSNRVAAIQNDLPEASWSHVVSKDNPADLNSRGLTSAEFQESSLWWTGPSWLKSNSLVTSLEVSSLDTDLEKRGKTTHLVKCTPLKVFDRISQWNRLLHTFGYVVRFINKTRKRWTQGPLAELSSFELLESERLILRQLQRQSFMLYIEKLSAGEPLPRTSTLTPLNPYMDEYHVVRLGGRLANSSLPELRKHPPILAPSKVVDQLIRYKHRTSLHGGTILTLGLLRQQYWITNARSQVKRIVRNCVRCARIKAKLGQQLMGDLPRERCEPARPFANCGVDYVGPFKVRTGPGRGNKSHKAWVAVFVCFATKAIHLEVVSDYSSKAFLAALERFVSRRGVPLSISSDNGTTFQGADKELQQTFARTLANKDVRSRYSLEGLEWKFIPPASPHFGGLWEAGVKSMKAHLRRAVGEFTPTYEEFSTILCSIESCLNSRPLVPLLDDPESLEVLTPGHFLTGTALKASPAAAALDKPNTISARWRQVVETTNSFWKAWQRDYLASLQTRNKWQRPQTNLKEGTLVVVKTPNLPPAIWPLARIIEIIPGPDGQVRVARIKTASSEYTRPITQLCPLPVDTTL